MKRLLVSLVILAIGAIIYIRMGIYNIAATEPHWKITYEILELVRTCSVAAHCKDVEVPPLKDAKLVKIGSEHFHHCCRMCHGAPKIPRGELAKGLYPVPPGLTGEETLKLHDTELYWIVKNGIKMTGMGAYAPTHTEQELWGIVAFLRKYPELGVKEYEDLTGYEESCDPDPA